MTMRCLTCLAPMAAQGTVFVCSGCGAEYEVTLADGSPAVFGGAPRRGIAGLMLGFVLVFALGAAGWAAVRFGWFEQKPAAIVQTLTAAAPDIRPDVAAAFAPEIRAGLIAGFGTRSSDAVAGLAVLEDARIAVLLTSGAAGPAEETALHLVLIDGTGTLATLALAGPATAAQLAAGPAGTLLVLGSGPDGLVLTAHDPRGARLWQQRWPAPAARGGAPRLLADAAGATVIAPGEAPDQLVVARVGPGGGLDWQRRFEIAPGGAAAASLREGALVLVVPTKDPALGERLRRLVLAPGGETVSETPLAGAGAGLAGVIAGPNGEDLILTSDPLVTLSAFGAEGERLWAEPLTGAVLHDRLILLPGPGGEALVVSAYRLASLQTDLVVSRVSPDGREAAPLTYRLPPGTAIGAAQVTGPETLLLAGELAAGPSAGPSAGTDAFLLALPARAGPIAAPPPVEAPPDTAPRPDPEIRLPETRPAPGPALSRPDPIIPVPETSPPPRPAPDPVITAPPAAICRFDCLRNGVRTTLSQPILSAELTASGGIGDLHTVLCAASGAIRAPASPPVCTPAP